MLPVSAAFISVPAFPLIVESLCLPALSGNGANRVKRSPQPAGRQTGDGFGVGNQRWDENVLMLLISLQRLCLNDHTCSAEVSASLFHSLGSLLLFFLNTLEPVLSFLLLSSFPRLNHMTLYFLITASLLENLHNMRRVWTSLGEMGHRLDFFF